MTPTQLAQAYVRCFCEAELGELKDLLSEDFSITGPLYTFTDRASFLARLRDLNAPRATYHIRHCVANNSDGHCKDKEGCSASVFFDYRLGKLELLMAMHFGISNSRISKALLVFDTARLPGRSG